MRAAGKPPGGGSRGGEGDLSETALLRLEINALRTELDFKNQNISLLNQINANMNASLKCREVYYLILTGVTAEPGLGFNRAMLFIRDPKEPVMSGALALSPDSETDMHQFYEEVEEKNFGFEFYIDQYYRSNLQVKNRLHKLVTGIMFDRSASNIINDTLSGRRPRYIRKATARDFTGIEALKDVLTKEFIIAPIYTADQEIGVVVADNFFTDHSLSPGDATSLSTLSKFAGSMITGARHAEEAEHLAVQDELTKAMNYKQLIERLTHEINRGARYKRAFSVVMVDLDDFRRFNELEGHLAGNKALIDVAALMRRHSRVVDTLARFGGEKFVIILPETDREGARRVGEKIRQMVEQHGFTGADGGTNNHVTTSVSVATYPGDGEDAGALLDQVTRLMHFAKAEGKNRVRV